MVCLASRLWIGISFDKGMAMFKKVIAPAPTPPPLPQSAGSALSSARERPVRRAVFKESMGMRLGHVSFDYSLIEKSHAKAESWINANPEVEIIQIETFHSSLHGITVVWHR